MARKLKPKVSWPDPTTAPQTWSQAEAIGVCINPIVTGIGSHPRSVADEDWVLSCERVVEEGGLAQFLTDLLHVLRLTIPQYLGEVLQSGEYPRRISDGDVPLPNVAYPGDRDWADDGWTEEMVGGVICNPVYAGIPPFPPIVEEQMWLEAGLRMVANVGLRQYLTNVLYQLKKSVAAVSCA
jgi:hypothetical protein